MARRASGSENIQFNDSLRKTEQRSVQIGLLNQSMLNHSLRFSSVISADLHISSKAHTYHSLF